MAGGGLSEQDLMNRLNIHPTIDPISSFFRSTGDYQHENALIQGLGLKISYPKVGERVNQE